MTKLLNLDELPTQDLGKSVVLNDKTHHMVPMSVGGFVAAQKLIQTLEGSDDLGAELDAVIAQIKGVFPTMETADLYALPLPKLTDMIYQRTALGRTLGYGTFDLQVPGAAVNLGKIPYVGSPDNTYLQISHLLWGASGPPRPKKIALSGQIAQVPRPGEAPSGAPSNITVAGEMDG